jgi:hypothetical protein
MVDDRSLSDADVSDLAFPFSPHQARRQHLERIFVVVKLDAVQIEHVDMLDAHDAQRIVDTGNEPFPRYPFTIVAHR